MKLNIVVTNTPPGNAPDYELFAIEELEKLPDACCTGMYTSSLDYIINRFQVLSEMIKKLRYGASIIIEGIDILDVARNLHIGALSVDEANTLLYCNGNSNSCDTLINVVDFLQQQGLKIKHKRMVNNRYSVEAVRPDAN